MQPLISNEDLSLFVEKKAEYYLNQWTLISDDKNAKLWNWSAVLLSGPWLLYRKMYLVATIFFSVILVETIISDFIFIDILGKESSPKLYDIIMTIVYPIICGSFGNNWYLWHAKRKITEIKQSVTSVKLQQDTISRKGGVSLLSAILGSILMITVWIVILVAVELLREGKI